MPLPANRTRRLLCAPLLLLFAATSALAQGQAVQPTLADIALSWVSGSWGSPLICQLGDRPVRGLRRISVRPGPRPTRPTSYRVTFEDLEIEEATRCFTELAGDVPNITGWVQIRLPGSHRTDTAERDFREALRRKKGFEFEIVSGSLRLQTVEQPLQPPRRVNFAGGKARFSTVGRGSDSAKLLAGFDTPRKLLMELEARDGTRLDFPLYVPKPK